uniref:Uncharacterized protein n=1 Tax=Glossina palpalis gambiensis TaxID=67801 RepID=A0A1B0B5N9_9MUSC
MPYERPHHNSEHTKKPFCRHDDVQVECAIFMPYDPSEEIKIKVETSCSEYANNKTRDKKNKKKVISPELTNRKFCTTSAPQINIENVTKVKSGSFLQITTASSNKEIDLKLKLTNQPEQIKCEAILKPATLHITNNAPKNAKSTFAMNYQEQYHFNAEIKEVQDNL